MSLIQLLHSFCEPLSEFIACIGHFLFVFLIPWLVREWLCMQNRTATGRSNVAQAFMST